MLEQVAGMTMEEFIRLYGEEGPFELINGERIPISPNIADHGTTISNLLKGLYRFESIDRYGEVLTEIPFVLADNPNWVKGSRVPDVMFFQKDRIVAYKSATPDWRAKPFVLVPDRVVEIVSPNDDYGDVLAKVFRYLED